MEQTLHTKNQSTGTSFGLMTLMIVSAVTVAYGYIGWFLTYIGVIHPTPEPGFAYPINSLEVTGHLGLMLWFAGLGVQKILDKKDMASILMMLLTGLMFCITVWRMFYASYVS